jgi:hypothetical protein
LGDVLKEGEWKTMSTTRKFVLAAMIAVTATAAMPVLSTGALAQCPPKCTNN